MTVRFSSKPCASQTTYPSVAVTDNERLYVPLLPHGSPMPAYALAEVVESQTDSLDRALHKVALAAEWAEPNTPSGCAWNHRLDCFFGISDVAQATKDDVVVVSGAAGATGSMAVQIAKKVIGCKKVIGIAGSDSKCRWVESLGADVCLNYKSSTFPEALAQATPEFVNVYFDNVGGDILSLLFTRMARYGRIAACGAIANYNHAFNQRIGVKNWFEVVAMRLQIKGFVVKDYAGRYEEALQVLMKALAEGKLKINSEVEHIVDSDFGSVPEVWMKLFTGANQGKLITRL